MRTDEELLHEYRKTRSEEAFSEIVARYGSLVFRTCLRMARGDAEDAMQATFMMLAYAPGPRSTNVSGVLFELASHDVPGCGAFSYAQYAGEIGTEEYFGTKEVAEMKIWGDFRRKVGLWVANKIPYAKDSPYDAK